MFIFQQNMSFSASQAVVLLHLTRIKYSLNAALDPRASVKNWMFLVNRAEVFFLSLFITFAGCLKVWRGYKP